MARWRSDIAAIRQTLTGTSSEGWRADIHAIAQSKGYQAQGWRDAIELISWGYGVFPIGWRDAIWQISKALGNTVSGGWRADLRFIRKSIESPEPQYIDVELYDPAERTPNYYLTSSGTTAYNTVWAITAYMDISNSIKIVYSGLTTVGVAPYSAWFDSNQVFISSFKQAIGTNTITVIPEAAKYLRFSVYATEVDAFSCIATKPVGSLIQNLKAPVSFNAAIQSDFMLNDADI